MKKRVTKVTVPMTWDKFEVLVQNAVRNGNRAEVILRDKKNKPYLRASFRLEPPSPSEVRIPCLIVPPSPFHLQPEYHRPDLAKPGVAWCAGCDRGVEEALVRGLCQECRGRRPRRKT